MFELNVIFVFSVYLYLSIVFECESALLKHRCQQLRPINGQARSLLVRGVTMAKITCFPQYVLVNGNETMTCVRGKWNSEFPMCAKLDSCHDNCGKISDGVGCSCDWSCHNNNNCCPDIRIKCSYIKPIDDTSRIYLSNSTTTTPTVMTTSEKNKMLNVTIPKNRDNNTITIGKLTLVVNSTVLMHRTPSNSTEISPTLNSTLKCLITRRSPNIVETNAFSLNNYSGVPAIATESTNLLENLKLNKIVGLSYVYNAIYIIGYLVAIGVILFIVKHSFYFMKSLIKKRTDAKEHDFVETNNEESRNIGLISNLQEY